MSYISGFVSPVPVKNKEAYRALAEKMAPLFIEYGATRVFETWGDFLPDGKTTDFKMAVKAEKDETVVFSWVEWPSGEVAKAAFDKMMKDPRMAPTKDAPFDGKRMIYGGFEQIVELKR